MTAQGVPIPPRGVSGREERVGPGIPPTRGERQSLARQIARFVADSDLVPPLSFAELSHHTHAFLRASGADARYLHYAAVLLSNAAWKDDLAAVPCDRRLLLLPQCLRSQERCGAKVDEYGLLCARCGACVIDALHETAAKLGYTVLVAEGTPVIVELIRSGRIQGVVGVSCLAALERVFPLMEAAAVPAVAIPLLRDGCGNTAVDVETVLEAMHRVDSRSGFLDMKLVQRQVEEWFTAEGLSAALGPAAGATDRAAREWLREAGKRWRPMLTACSYAALRPEQATALPEDLRRLAVAVECFHKASLVHDDIEDGDALRYGRQTLHERWGVPIALNVGDLLLGEGYRLIGECGLPGEIRLRLLQAAAGAHRELCLGQGDELSWLRDFRPLTVEDVIDVFRRKTAPAFAVALRFGAICAGVESGLLDVLDAYSVNFGIAYQIQDDLADLAAPAAVGAPRPSIVTALAYAAAAEAQKARLRELWRSGAAAEMAQVVAQLGAEQAARDLLRAYLDKAMTAMTAVRISRLKKLLRRVLGSIFPEALLCDPAVFPQAPAREAAND